MKRYRFDDKQAERTCNICGETFTAPFCSYSLWRYRKVKAHKEALGLAIRHLLVDHNMTPSDTVVKDYIRLNIETKVFFVLDIINTPAIFLIMLHDVLGFILDKTIFADDSK